MIMSSAKDLFIMEPSMSALKRLKRAELVEFASHYKLTVSSSMKKDDIHQEILEYLCEEEQISDDEDMQESSSTTLELKRLEFQENEKARENAVHLKELELREKELNMQLRIKELEAQALPTREPASKTVGFDISKHIRFVPPFQEQEIDKYFLDFEKVATSLEWPKDAWTLLLQSVLIGKAWEIYAALSLDQSSEYETVKTSILHAYEVVLEAYRQKFRESTKGNT